MRLYTKNQIKNAGYMIITHYIDLKKQVNKNETSEFRNVTKRQKYWQTNR